MLLRYRLSYLCCSAKPEDFMTLESAHERARELRREHHTILVYYFEDQHHGWRELV